MECLGDASINTTATESITENSRIGENLEHVTDSDLEIDKLMREQC